MEKRKLILASNSPRRKELLSLCNIPFTTIAADINETINTNNSLKDEIITLAYNKAYEVFKDHTEDIVIGSDTIVVINNEVLGKPKTDENAKIMLEKLSGKAHEVITATAIISKEEVYKNVNVSKVYFNDLSEKEIDDYIKSKEPHDKAGAYGIQGLGGCFINKIEGDYYSIMGLTLNYVYTTLKKLQNENKL